MKSTESWLDATSDGRNFAVALAAGLALEVAVLLLVLPLVSRPAPPAQVLAPVRLTIAAPPAPKPPPAPPKPKPPVAPPLPKPPPPVPVTPPLPQPPPPPPAARPAPRPMPRPAVRRVLHVQTPPSPRPSPLQPPVQAAPPPPPAPAAPSAGQVDLFRDAVRRAVQQVANSVYPQGAQESGEVEITITYLNGRALSVTLARSSGFPLLDAAALDAGRIAQYPLPPPAFANHVFPWTVTVIFQQAAPSLDGD
jgi:protein TonB